MGRERELRERDGSHKRSRKYSQKLKERTPLAEMAIEIWVMCQLTEKLFETRFDETSRFECLCRYSEIQVAKSISGCENGKRPSLSRKKSDILNIWQ